MNALIEQINSTGKTFIDFALPMLMQSSVLTVILLALDMLLRKKIRAVFRYWIWMIVLVKLILPPSLSLPTSPAYWFGDKIINSAQNQPIQEEPVTYSFSNLEIALPSNDFTSTVYRPEPVFNSEEPAATPPVISKVPLSWQAIAFLSWLSLSLIMFILLIQRTFFVKRLINQSQNADEKLNNILEQARLQMSLKKQVVMRLSDTAMSPSVCGLFKPVILILQKLVKTISSNDFKAILLHELAHIKRNDLWVNLVQAILQIIYIYNLLLWIANIMIRNIREQAVDEMVLVAMGEQAEEYPKTLLNISRLSFGSAALSLRLIGVAESKKALITRIKHITCRPFPKTVKLGVTGLTAIILAAFVLLPMAKAQQETETKNVDVEAKYVDVREYLRGNITGYIGYSKTRKVIKQDDLPILYELLDDDEYAPYRIAVVGAIGYVSDDPESVNVLLKFIQRNDNKKHDMTWFMSKAGAFSMMGLIGGDTADSILRKGITKEGARELTKDWIDEPLTANFNTERMIEAIQIQSFGGLLISGKPENLTLVEKMYNEQKQISIKNHKNTELMSYLINDMAAKDYIAETNLETYMDLGGQSRERVLLPYSQKYRFDLNEEESAEADRKAKYIETTDYIKQNGQMQQVEYGETRELIAEDDLPILYELLDDDAYAPYWHKVVATIGYVSKDPNTVNVLLNFIQRNDNKKLDRHSILSKAGAFGVICSIGGDMAESIIRKSVTKEGVKELTKDWIDEPLPETFDTERMIRMIRYSSLSGLVISGKPENLALVEKMYNEEKEISLRNHERTELMNGLIDAMVVKDCIAEAGLETWRNMSSQLKLRAMEPHTLKYLSDLADVGLYDPNIIEVLNKALEESTEAEREAKYNEVVEFIKKNSQLDQLVYLYNQTLKVITKDELPMLYEFLDNDEYSEYWNKVVKAIGFVSDDPESVNVLLKFIRKNDNKKLGMFSPYSKGYAFSMIGLIGGDTADSILRKSVTKEGILELTKDWIDQPLPSPFDAKVMIELMQKNTLDGLVLSRKPENLALVEKLYNEQKEISIKNQKNSELMSSLIEAMAAKDYIAEKGLESYLNNEGRYKLSILLPYIHKYRFSLNEEASPEAVREAKNKEVRECIKKGGQLGGEGMYYDIRDVISKDELPILYELLDDDEYAPYWHKVVAAIGFISEDPGSVNVLLKFIQRNDNKKLDRYSYRSKPSAFGAISRIGGDAADSVLRKSVTKEGARELTKDWIDEPLPETVDTERMIILIQQSSISGLVVTGKPENIALIEKLYNEQKEISIKNHKKTELMSALIDAMATKDYLAEADIDTLMIMSGTQRLSVLSPYLNKYSFDLNEEE